MEMVFPDMKKALYFIVCALMLLSMASCVTNPPKQLRIEPYEVSLPLEGGDHGLRLTCEGEWSSSPNRDWISLDPRSGIGPASITLTCAKGRQAEGKVVFTAGDESYTLIVRRGDTPPSTPGTAPDGVEMVDLGLSVKWANMNVGAQVPEDYGEYFAWGEIIPKMSYDWETYRYCNGSSVTQLKYCIHQEYGFVDGRTQLELADDAAYMNWGEPWRMPTSEEMQELLEQCTWTWTTQNAVNGYLVSSKTNTNSIFIPAAGYRYESTLYDAGSFVCFWSSTLLDTYSSGAVYISFKESSAKLGNGSRCYGPSVRPVCP